MNILVTGSTGFVGTRLCEILRANGHSVFESNSNHANLHSPANLSIYDNTQFDLIFHLAAYTKAGDWCLDHPGEQWVMNQLINTSMLSYWLINQPQAKLVCVGTSCAYAPAKKLEESNYLVGEPEEGIRTYAMTKRMVLEGLQAISKQFPQMKWLYVVPNTLYGPNFKEGDNHFIYDLLRKVSESSETGSPIEVWGNGNQKRELLHVDDFIQLMMRITNYNNMVVNIGPNKEHTINYYVKKLCGLYGIPKEENRVVHKHESYVGVRSKKLDTAVLTGLVGDFAFRPLDEGLEELRDYYESTKEALEEVQ